VRNQYKFQEVFALEIVARENGSSRPAEPVPQFSQISRVLLATYISTTAIFHWLVSSPTRPSQPLSLFLQDLE
jgi:hypothetical protein